MFPCNRGKIGTFGRNYSNGKSDKRKRILDKVWVFAAHHKLDSIKRRKFSTLENERKHSVLNYLTSDHYVERELVCFQIMMANKKMDIPAFIFAKVYTPFTFFIALFWSHAGLLQSDSCCTL